MRIEPEPDADQAPAAEPDPPRPWAMVPAPVFVGGNQVDLLEGGDQLFPRMCAALEAARQEVWLATYIFHHGPAGQEMAQALARTAARGVRVRVVVDGFGSLDALGLLRGQMRDAGVELEVFRPLDHWYAWLRPGQLRRLHQKLLVCDTEVAFVGGINIIDDRLDIHHGWGETPRLDFAVELRGPLASAVEASAKAMWTRAKLGRGWRDEVKALARSSAPVTGGLRLLRRLRVTRPAPAGSADMRPVRAAFVVRDNLRQRRAIERSYVEAIRAAKHQVDIAVPYFYPGSSFRRALCSAARRGVQVRLLLQGKVDYRIAGVAARVLYEEMRADGISIYEYTPAFLHAKVAVVDDDWATVGSSNIDPLSLLLNLEANVVVRDRGFANQLRQRLEAALALSEPVLGQAVYAGWRGWLHRAGVAWMAHAYLRLAGITGRY